MVWNLVDEIQRRNTPYAARRPFYPPLASTPPGQDHASAIDHALYSFQEEYVTLPTPDGATSDIGLTVYMQTPSGGFANEHESPDPHIRLHAVDAGRIHFEPAAEGRQDCLILEMQSFASLQVAGYIHFPPWFQRWRDANSIPKSLIYENVDRAQLRQILDGVGSTVAGLHFPPEVNVANKSAYIAQFLTGSPDHYLIAEAGAVIGSAGIDPENHQQRCITFHARYQDHTPSEPHPINPRELLHLLFGDDSPEAQNHPLLKRLQEVGQNEQGQLYPISKRMHLRPPLRTWKRLQWEAEQEVSQHAQQWRPEGHLAVDTFYNDHVRQHSQTQRHFHRAGYAGFNKCNVFVSDLCIRAGFCVCVHPVGDDRWHFMDANSYTNSVHQLMGSFGRLPVRGSGEDAQRVWAWKIENEVRACPPEDRQNFLNAAMHEEGRCFLLAGARARQFIAHPILNGPTAVLGIANCEQALRPIGIGHIVIVQAIQSQPLLTEKVGAGLEQIEVQTWEATSNGAISRTLVAKVGAKHGDVIPEDAFIRLHLFELQPGGDPDTNQGLRSLNVLNLNRNLLMTADEAAADARITHYPDGSEMPPPPAQQFYCHDNYPSSAPPTIQSY